MAVHPPATPTTPSTAIGVCVVALLVAAALGVAFGSGPAGLADVFAFGTRAHEIVVGVRLPRVLMGVVAGAGVAAVGGSFQSLPRHPLAQPYLLRVSGRAPLRAPMAI